MRYLTFKSSSRMSSIQTSTLLSSCIEISPSEFFISCLTIFIWRWKKIEQNFSFLLSFFSFFSLFINKYLCYSYLRYLRYTREISKKNFNFVDFYFVNTIHFLSSILFYIMFFHHVLFSIDAMRCKFFFLLNIFTKRKNFFRRNCLFCWDF